MRQTLTDCRIDSLELYFTINLNYLTGSTTALDAPARAR